MVNYDRLWIFTNHQKERYGNSYEKIDFDFKKVLSLQKVSEIIKIQKICKFGRRLPLCEPCKGIPEGQILFDYLTCLLYFPNKEKPSHVYEL